LCKGRWEYGGEEEELFNSQSKRCGRREEVVKGVGVRLVGETTRRRVSGRFPLVRFAFFFLHLFREAKTALPRDILEKRLETPNMY
jgi:hypothetical protein